MKAGDCVRLTVNGKTVDAVVILASPNGRSLMFGFDDALPVAGGMVFSFLPVLQDDDEVYRSLIGSDVVQIKER